MAVAAKINLTVNALETGTTGLSQTKSAPHLMEFAADYATGTGSNQQDRVYSTVLSLAGSAQTIDLLGSLTDSYGAALSFVEVTGIFIKNNSTTTGQFVTIGAGSNPFITWLKATGDGVVLGPGGIFCLTSPIDGYAPTAGTGDILTFDPGALTFTVSVLIIGRSA